MAGVRLWPGSSRGKAGPAVAWAALLGLVPVAGVVAAGAADPALAASSPAPVCSAGSCTVSFTTTGTGQSYTVPAGVTSLSVALFGGTGGTNFGGDVTGGDGAEVTAALAVNPGDMLSVDVGGAGGSGADGGAGGVNGGGNGNFGGGGGGASDVTSSGTILLAAGGGGGAGSDENTCNDRTTMGGTGGNADTAGGTGAPGTSGDGTLGGGGGGQPGVATGPSAGPGSGGTGGTFSGTNPCGGVALTGGSGNAGSGMTGGNGLEFVGAGGGGYYGGGSGGNGADDFAAGLAGGGGGGGGASYTGGTGVSGATVNDTGNPYGSGVSGGSGEAVFSYPDPVTTGSPGYTVAGGQTLTVPVSTGLLSSKAGTTGPAGDTLTVSGPASGTTAQGGTVSVSSDGLFSYTPPSASFAGADSFAYTITDSSADYTAGTATIQVQPAWPASVTGKPLPAAGSGAGYYLGASGNTWTLEVTHPGTAKAIFTGTITINAGYFTKLSPIQLERGDTASLNGKAITFQFTNDGRIDGIRFTTPAAATSITFTLDISRQAAAASQIYLGSAQTLASTGSPLTFTR